MCSDRWSTSVTWKGKKKKKAKQRHAPPSSTQVRFIAKHMYASLQNVLVLQRVEQKMCFAYAVPHGEAHLCLTCRAYPNWKEEKNPWRAEAISKKDSKNQGHERFHACLSRFQKALTVTCKCNPFYHDGLDSRVFFLKKRERKRILCNS